jgi:hypothetical protein
MCRGARDLKRTKISGKDLDMASEQCIPATPKGAGPSGKALWRDILGKFELEEHEMALLREAVRTVDDLDGLAAVVARDGRTVGAKVHPALVESRQLRLVLARVLAALRMPAGDERDLVRRPQRRVGVRGFYAPKGGE